MPTNDRIVDTFLHLTGVPGESTDRVHEGAISVLGWKWGMSKARVAAGTSQERADLRFQHLRILKAVDRSTCHLYQACFDRKQIREATLVCRKAGGDPHEYLKIKLGDVRVERIETRFVEEEDEVREEVSLAGRKIQVEYHEQQSDGSGRPAGNFGWDVARNVKL